MMEMEERIMNDSSTTKVGTYEEHPNWKSWRGRMSGTDYLVFSLIFPIVASIIVLAALFMRFCVLDHAGEALQGAGNAVLVVVIVWLVIVRFSASVRRFHDFGLSGLWLLVFYLGETFCACGILAILMVSKGDWTLDSISMVIKDSWFWLGLLGLLEIVVFVFLPGTCGPNKFGPDTKGRLNSKKGDLANIAQTTKELKELVKMKASGRITESEYEERRARILNGG